MSIFAFVLLAAAGNMAAGDTAFGNAMAAQTQDAASAQPAEAPLPEADTFIAPQIDTTPPAPPAEDLYRKCLCGDEEPETLFSFTGVPRDAQVTLSADGLSVEDRQATVFTVSSSESPSIKGEIRIWHSTKPADCGLTFDYGKRYNVRAYPTSAGLETDWCVDPRRTASPQKQGRRN